MSLYVVGSRVEKVLRTGPKNYAVFDKKLGFSIGGFYKGNSFLSHRTVVPKNVQVFFCQNA